MARENEGYRDELEQIVAFFGGKHLLTQTDVSRYTGLCRNTVKKRFGAGDILATRLARELTKRN